MVENANILIVIVKVYLASYFVVEIQKHDADLPIVFMIFFFIVTAFTWGDSNADLKIW